MNLYNESYDEDIDYVRNKKIEDDIDEIDDEPCTMEEYCERQPW